ncbi:MAG TPA: VWA domain-containing protein [Planctomycetota bacterium]|nr:VWA domain-containing protein [Planctomycetota bacterium]
MGPAALLLAIPAVLLGQPSDKEHAQALRELSRLEKTAEVESFLEAMRTVLAGDDARSVRAAVDAYARFATPLQKKLSPGDFLAMHGKARASFAQVKSSAATAEYSKLLASHSQWMGRLLLLDGLSFVHGVDPLQGALTALRDENPIVVRRSLQYLATVKKVPVLEAIIRRYLELTKKRPKGLENDWDRARLAFQSVLQRSLHVDLPEAEDYKNYFEARKADPRLFDPPKEPGSGASRVTLFGAAVTGKNIAFVLDISGSMTTRDPYPPGEEPKEDLGKTVVGDPKDGSRPVAARIVPEERERMYRAKKELVRVIRAIASDVRFNIITYSSSVATWKKAMVPASDANKGSAAEYVDALKPEGLTATDMALEEAFTDPSVDTIYLVTDGAPTHQGVQGAGLPEDALQIISGIHSRVAELNYLRGVRIFTLGFAGAHEEFLKKLAQDHAGSYVSIR